MADCRCPASARPDIGGVRLQPDLTSVVSGFSRTCGALLAFRPRMPTKYPRYPRHLTGFSYVGFHRYSLTFCTADRAAIFTDGDSVRGALTQILRAAREEGMAIIAYCFMPDHLHLIAEGVTEQSDLKKFVRRAKQYSGYEHSQRTRQRLWQRYGYEHVVRDNESLRQIVRYVIENPVRAGLVQHPRDYPFLGSGLYTLEQLMDFAYDRKESE